MADYKNSNLGSRSEKKSKKRKANRIYNILLTIVILAIIAVGVSIFTGNNDEQANQADNNTAEKSEDTNKQSDKETDSDKDKVDNNAIKEESEEDAEKDDTEQEATEENTIVENSGDSNVVETYVNESWKPVGTTQTGEHVTSYSKESVDWQEMEQALAYGAGLSESDMTVWYLGNGGSANKAIGTVSPKDHSTTYRVYIEWVDGGGWKPIKVEQLKENDKITR